MVEISIVIPVKDEAENIEPLAAEIDSAFHAFGKTWEAIWVDDGSADESLEKLRGLAAKDGRHRFLSFAANAGQSAALCAGVAESRGRYICTLDGDGQNDPGDLPHLLAQLIADAADMVNGYRRKRRDHIIRRVSSRIANGFRNLATGKTVRDVGCSTRVFKRECFQSLPRFKGMHRFLPTLADMQGHRLLEYPVHHRPRTRGATKYTINNRLWVGLYDVFGIRWLRKRAFAYRIQARSPASGSNGKDMASSWKNSG